MHGRVPALLLTALTIGGPGWSVLASSKAEPPAEPVAWTSYGYDNQLRNAVSSKALTLRTVTGLVPSWTAALDGPVYASPLAARIGAVQVLYLATEGGSIYALEAATGRTLWQRQLGTVTTEECGTWGITSTGTIDLTRGLLYAIGAEGSLHALSLATGDEASGYPRRLVADPQYQYVWGGLRMARDLLYVPIASYCDVGAPDGSFPDGALLAVSLDRPDQPPLAWDPVAGPGNLGGIWGWGGVSVDPIDGNIYTGVGNSHVWQEQCACYVDDAGYGDHVVELTPDLGTVLDSHLPDLMSTGDYDFGAAPLLFQPKGCPPLAAANNKIGTLFVWDRKRLFDGPVASIPLADGVSAFVGAPAWSASRQTIYAAQSVLYGAQGRLGSGVRAFHVDPGCRFRPTWAMPLGEGNQAKPLVVGDVVFATGGWTGGFYALSAATGAKRWSFPTSGGTVAAMITVEGAVYGADTTGTVYAFRPASER